MKATLPKTETNNARNYSGEKELTDSYKVIAHYKGELIEVIDCRCWMGRSRNASQVYASIWVRDSRNHRHYSGKGTAGGWGYHKSSSAIGEAIDSAGIKLWGDVYDHSGKDDCKKQAHIGGVGETAIREALTAIAKKLGYRKTTIVN